MKHLLIGLIAFLLSGCYNGDLSFNEPEAKIILTRKGCRSDSATSHTNALMVNVTSKELPDGRTQCVIETVTVKPQK